MTKRLNALLAQNPKAAKDRAVIEAALKAVRDLKRQGIGGQGYRLASPFDTHRIKRTGIGGRMQDMRAAAKPTFSG